MKQKGKDAHTAVKTTAKDRVRSYESGVLHENHDVLFGSMCNVVLDHSRKSSVDKNFESTTHKTKSTTSKESKQKTLKTTLNCKTGAQVIYYKSLYCCLLQT